jgi:hypothetical protein
VDNQTGQAGGSNRATLVDRARLDAAADLLWRFDPEQHNLSDYALSIGETILGASLCPRDAETDCIGF